MSSGSLSCPLAGGVLVPPTSTCSGEVLPTSSLGSGEGLPAAATALRLRTCLVHVRVSPNEGIACIRLLECKMHSAIRAAAAARRRAAAARDATERKRALPPRRPAGDEHLRCAAAGGYELSPSTSWHHTVFGPVVPAATRLPTSRRDPPALLILRPSGSSRRPAAPSLRA